MDSRTGGCTGTPQPGGTQRGPADIFTRIHVVRSAEHWHHAHAATLHRLSILRIRLIDRDTGREGTCMISYCFLMLHM